MSTTVKPKQNALIDQPAFVPAHRCEFWNGRVRDYCVVIPVINEGERILSLLEKMNAIQIPERADVLIVDGGSTDGSMEQSRLVRLGVQGLLTKTAAGKLSTQLLIAYGFAVGQGYKGVVTIDGNDKDDPAPIFSFIQQLEGGVDFVQASRFIPGGHQINTPLSRALAIKLLHAPLLSLFSGFRWTDTTQGFRAYSSRLISDSRMNIFRPVFSTYELLAYMNYRAPRLGFKCLELPTSRVYPEGEVPTKIAGFRGNIALIRILLNACFGRYNG